MAGVSKVRFLVPLKSRYAEANTHSCRNPGFPLAWCGSLERCASSECRGNLWSRYLVVAGVSRVQASVPLKTHRAGERCRLNLGWSLGRPPPLSGRGNLLVKVSGRGWCVTSSSPVPLKTHRAGERCRLNLSRAQTSSRWCVSAVPDYCQLTGTLPPLFNSLVGGNMPGRSCFRAYGSNAAMPG
ncbi:hypothetical protein TNCV_2549791, partial [Trichonephila clavipes]